MLKIMTPLSRPENLMALFYSIAWQDSPDEIKGKMQWDIVIDQAVFSNGQKSELIYQFQEFIKDCHWIRTIHSPISKSFVGHSHRNYYLDNYAEENDFIYFLDDDTIMHPDFYKTLVSKNAFSLECMAILFDQDNANGDIRLKVDPTKISVGNIDMGMYIINNKFTEGLRFEADNYCADGVFIENFLKKQLFGGPNYLIIHQPLSIYNKLRP